MARFNLHLYGIAVFVAVSLVYVFLSRPFSFTPRVADISYGRLREIKGDRFPRYAIATFLSEDPSEENSPEDYYFLATRILAYQLLHDPATRCNRTNIPFVVLVTDEVNEAKRNQLTRDGAKVVRAQDIPLTRWTSTGATHWKNQFNKLRLLEMTQYDRVLFLDADTILTRPIDGIFNEPESQVAATSLLVERPKQIRWDEGQPPAEYVFAARSDSSISGQRDHPFPPERTDEFGAGFWLAAPSEELYQYFLNVMSHYHRFDPTAIDRSLLNYAFRRDGTMPWQELNYTWSATWPNSHDVEGGVVSLHEKFWREGPDDLKARWLALKKKMETYLRAS
ncbi:nucleotide-diphospho-sugar transferase [Talaromyces proteolyticus]|uniref:Nucleotide-diphospho-sugar transferase n=1 Tax=Talaromyces proteolyticus TaxID=1131652 RepID=A0AAD4KSP7_9EURO|nr:nucleotide-diphospho-sugar transferase [Talaromyces proteolyticus]KAH8697888.1 nucleotide-diphospho-sugar transferase [Talaromyces proteolyticus]